MGTWSDMGSRQMMVAHAYFLVGYFFDGEAFEAEHVFIERNGFVERGHGDTDVFDM